MDKIIFKSDSHWRLFQVLRVLDIHFIYSENQGLFLSQDSTFIIYETEEEKAHIGDILNTPQLRAFCKIIQIHPNGSLTYEDGSDVRIKYCNKCRKFYFDKKVKSKEDFCPECHSSSIKYLSNNSRIPGWFEKKKITIIDDDEVEKHMESFPAEEFGQKDKIIKAVKSIISRLQGNVCFIKISYEKKRELEKLKDKYPNMTEVIDYILQSFASSELRENKEISFRPVLLVGGPGCGKTSFTNELCTVLLEKKPVKVDLGNGVCDFTITGSDPSIQKAKHGLIIEAMFSTKDHPPIKNPIIHFDELDKIKADDKYSPETVFYSILEKNTARRFFDNFIGVNVDASGVNYIFTANKLDTIPAPILNRLRIFKIEDYTHEQLKNHVIGSFYKEWILNNRMEAEYLPEVLSDFIKEEILKECHDDTRSIEDAINTIFTRTLAEDSESGHKIALFSPEEMYNGWKNYRGKKIVPKQKIWQLPENFIPPKKEEEEEEPFNLMDYLENYNPENEEKEES
jgi:ATP-dependent Lon protease